MLAIFYIDITFLSGHTAHAALGVPVEQVDAPSDPTLEEPEAQGRVLADTLDGHGGDVLDGDGIGSR